jgi:hypothetical protein
MKNIINNGEQRIHTTWSDCTVTQHERFSCEILVFTLKTTLNFKKKLYMMDKSWYDFRIQRVEIGKKDAKYFKQWNHYRPV